MGHPEDVLPPTPNRYSMERYADIDVGTGFENYTMMSIRRLVAPRAGRNRGSEQIASTIGYFSGVSERV
jgi:hypothetical protein